MFRKRNSNSDTTGGAAENRKQNVSVITVGGGDRAGVHTRKKQNDSSTSAFGGDDRHFDFSIAREGSEKSKREGTPKEELTLDPKFGTATLSKSALVTEKIQEIIKRDSIADEITNGNNDKIDVESGSQSAHSEHSADASDDPSSTSGSVDVYEPSATPRSWMSFSQSLFAVKGSNSYCCAPLQQPLLMKRVKADHLASLASWVTILRIMGDLPDEDTRNSISLAGQTPSASNFVRTSYQKKYSKKDIEDAHRKYTELFKNPMDFDVKGVPFMLDRGSGTMLEKVQFICALGIYRPDVRDELYCQICRQLTNNPSRNSTVRGWVLLYLLAGSFSPTERFSSCFLQFLHESPPHFAQRVERLLRRTFMTGTRGFPPSWLEFQAAKNGKPILLPVALMDGQRMLVEADSVTTVHELSRQISNRIGLIDTAGFSIYITLMQRISCLGHGQHRIMDAVAECEQHTKQAGHLERSSTWRLYYRKEYFTPWQDSKPDTVGIDLIYQQVMRGISVCEYKCGNEEILRMMAAQRYYVEFSDNLNDEKLHSFLSGWLPPENKKEHDIPYWVERVSETLKKDILQSKVAVESLKSDIVTFARNKWFSLFSRFYDATKMIGPAGSWANVIIGLNCRGVHVLDEAENLKNQILFVEISSVTRGKQYVTINTIKNEEYAVFSHHSEDLYQLLSKFLDGLKRKSKYALIVQDFTQNEGAIGSNLQKGDLIVLDQPYEHFTQSDVFSGICKRTSKPEKMPRDIVYILPVAEEPTNEILGMMVVQLKKEYNLLLSHTSSISQEYTLEEFAKTHFRSAAEKRMSRVFSKASFKKKSKEAQLWQFSKEPLKKPLLRRTLAREELKRTSCRAYLAIQQFMGDAPNKDAITSSELANIFIIDPAMRSRHFREETFCQIIKQLTDNPEKSSVDKGWQLLYALSMTCVTGGDVFEECDRFMRDNNHKLAKACRERMRQTKLNGSRQYPPHVREYDMVASGKSKLQIDVVFPFKSVEAFEYDPGTRVSDFKKTILEKFKLIDHLEYGVFFGLRDRVLSVNDGDYLMDAMTHVEKYWVPHANDRRSNSQPSPPSPKGGPHIFFMKKLWVNANPGVNRTADMLFHFPQELPNYLRGYHMCSDLDVAQMAAYIYRAQFGDEASSLQHLDDNLQAVVPRNLIQSRTGNEWKKAIETHYKAANGKSSDDMKGSFLDVLHQLPTYGSVFFEVKQRSLKGMPSHVLLAVNAFGVVLLDPDSKNVLAKYDYSMIPNWAYDEYSFTLVVGESSSNATKVLFETNVGHNLDDIVMAYVGWMMNMHIKKRPTYSGVTVGESMC